MSWNDNPSLNILTDSKIDRYVLAGRYGDERKNALLQRLRRKKQAVCTDARELLKMLCQQQPQR